MIHKRIAFGHHQLNSTHQVNKFDMHTMLVVCLLLFVDFIGMAAARQSHFGDPCFLCRCFVEYSDRDIAVPYRPYAIAVDGYDTTEDRCLATCRRDKRCRAAVYGMVGGRKVFTCEFYDEIDSKNSPIYVPFVNVYIKKSTCQLKDDHLPTVRMMNADGSSLKRRKKYEKFAKKPNPFNG